MNDSRNGRKGSQEKKWDGVTWKECYRKLIVVCM